MTKNPIISPKEFDFFSDNYIRAVEIKAQLRILNSFHNTYIEPLGEPEVNLSGDVRGWLNDKFFQESLRLQSELKNIREKINDK